MKDLKMFDSNAVVTMSSVEIAELTGKLHKNVMRDIRDMLEELYIRTSQLNSEPTSEEELRHEVFSRFSGTYLDSQNKRMACYRLPKREVHILITGYSATLRAGVIDRVEELEKKVQQKLLGTAREVVRLLDDLPVEERVEVYREVISRLPDEDEEAATPQPISYPTECATNLLRKVREKYEGFNLSTADFNLLLQREGLLEVKRTRVQKDWEVTLDGLEFGKNGSDETDANKTNPYWYGDKFEDLLVRIGCLTKEGENE